MESTLAVSHSHLRSVFLHHIFPLYPINGTIFGRGGGGGVADISNIKYINRSSRKVPVILVRLYRNLNLLDRFSKKNPPNTKFHSNPSSGCGVIPYRLTDMAKLMAAFRKLCEKKNRFKAHHEAC